MPAISSVGWRLRQLPTLTSAGVFPMIVPGCNQAYAHPTIALHLHDYSGDIWIGAKRYDLKPGDITLSPGKITSRYHLVESGSHLCVHFLPPKLKTGRERIHLPLHSRLGPQVVAARERLWRIIDHSRQAGGRLDSVAACAASASLQEFLLWLSLQNRGGETSRRSSLADEALAKLNRAIDTSLARPMLVGELASHVGLSAEYVTRLFARRHGMTLQHCLLLRRIELARHLLVSSDLLISEIGNRVGIPDPQYFNKQFRRIVGQSPLAYRRIQAATKKPTRRSAAGAR